MVSITDDDIRYALYEEMKVGKEADGWAKENNELVEEKIDEQNFRQHDQNRIKIHDKS